MDIKYLVIMQTIFLSTSSSAPEEKISHASMGAESDIDSSPHVGEGDSRACVWGFHLRVVWYGLLFYFGLQN